MNLTEQKKSIPYAVKSNLANYKEVDTSSRTIKAVVNTLNYFDHDYDVLIEGVATRSIKERGAKTNANDKILHALFHDLTKLPGKSKFEAETAVDGNKVLYVESEILETQEGEETLLKYEKEIYNQHSIGFAYQTLTFTEKDTKEWDKLMDKLINPEDAQKVGYCWIVKEINWYEYSTVAFGANKLTPYLGTKSENKLVVYDTIIKKLTALIEKANRFEIKNNKLFELQYKQLQQMLLELIKGKPLSNDPLIKSIHQGSSFDLHNAINNIKI